MMVGKKEVLKAAKMVVEKVGELVVSRVALMEYLVAV